MDWPARAGWTGMTTSTRTIALLWRGTGDTPVAETRNYGRLLPVFNALNDIGVIATPVLYDEATAGDVRGQLLAVDAVLVWVDPIAGGQRREALDSLLREVSVSGRWVSAHPDVIDRIGTKEVLYETRDLGWGADTDIYLTAAELRERLPSRLKSGAPRVLKQSRGNGGLESGRSRRSTRPATPCVSNMPRHATTRPRTSPSASSWIAARTTSPLAARSSTSPLRPASTRA